MIARRFSISVSICSIAWRIAALGLLGVAATPQRRRAAAAGAPRPCSVSSWSSRAQRARSASAAAIELRSRSDSTLRPARPRSRRVAANVLQQLLVVVGERPRRRCRGRMPPARPSPPRGEIIGTSSAVCASGHAELARRRSAGGPRRRRSAPAGARSSTCAGGRLRRSATRTSVQRRSRRPRSAATTSSSPSRSMISDGCARRPARAALDDQLEHALEPGLAADRDRDVACRLEPAHGALELDRGGARWARTGARSRSPSPPSRRGPPPPPRRPR